MKNNNIKPGELTGFLTFAAALLFALFVTWVAGCGDADIEPGEAIVAPVIDITCDAPVGEPRCFILVYGADNVEAYYGARVAWWDEGVTEPRAVYLDSPPPGVLFSVVACNIVGCTEENLFIARMI